MIALRIRDGTSTQFPSIFSPQSIGISIAENIYQHRRKEVNQYENRKDSFDGRDSSG
jgi:hypothetical protein